MSSPARTMTPRRARFPLARVAAAVTLLSWVIQGVQRSTSPEVVPPPPTDVVPSWATDINQNVGSAPEGGRVVTGKLLDGQKPARGGTCGTEDQVAIGKGCWVLLDKRPKPPPLRCGDYFEYASRCYIPVKAEPKLPTSITQ